MSQTYKSRTESVIASKMQELYDKAVSLLKNNEPFVKAVQEELLKNETLLGSDVAKIKKQFM